MEELKILEPKLEQVERGFEKKTDSLQGKLKPLREQHDKMTKDMMPYRDDSVKAVAEPARRVFRFPHITCRGGSIISFLISRLRMHQRQTKIVVPARDMKS